MQNLIKDQMGCCETHLLFTADLFTLSKQYYDVIMHIRQTNLFKQPSKRLEKVVEIYLKNPKNFDIKNKDLLAVDTAHKLHPLDYGTNKVNKDYLIKACLRQEQFCRRLNVKDVNYENTLKNYEKFLNMVKSRPGKITVPTLYEDFMWHSHMTDHERYKVDTKKFLGFVLNHDDEIPKQKLKGYWDDNLQKRQNVYGKKFQQYKIPNSKKQNPQQLQRQINQKVNQKVQSQVKCDLC